MSHSFLDILNRARPRDATPLTSVLETRRSERAAAWLIKEELTADIDAEPISTMDLAPAPDPLEEVRTEYLAAVEQLNAHRCDTPFDTAQVVELAMVIAEAVIGRELGPDDLLDNVEQALAQIGKDPAIRLRVSPEDLPHLQARPDLVDHLDVIADEDIRRGGCIVESTTQAIDGTIDGRLRRYKTALLEAM